MSYARFGWDGSDVYVFLSVGGKLECCGCSLRPRIWTYDSTAAMLAHLEDHRAAGHTVPDDCIERLKEEREKNDLFIADASRDSDLASDTGAERGAITPEGTV